MAQEESWDAVISISFLTGESPRVSSAAEAAPHATTSDPKVNTDFSTLIDAKAFREVAPGHTCVPIKNPPSSVGVGSNATLQIKYSSEFDKPGEETFYACADITYVESAGFTASIPCFNATEPSSDEDLDGGNIPPSDLGSKNRVGLSGAAIAGIVVGSVAGVSALAVVALLVYRRRQQRLHMLRRQRSSRGVRWEEQPGRDSKSNPSVEMHNMS